MLALIGTVPDKDFPLLTGEVSVKEECLIVGNLRVTVNRGTPALLAAAAITSDVLGQPPSQAYLAGDIGLGVGSRRLYAHLVDTLPNINHSTLTFHYLQPIVHWHDRLLAAVEKMPGKPKLIADAGYMYMAKMSGKAVRYDLFTPDVGELAFLADEEAPHPFYTRGFILHEENRLPELARRAYEHGNAALHLLIKGKMDYLATADGIMERVDEPMEESMEAIGGTGDTLTGIVSVLVDSGMEIRRSAVVAARANRLAGHLARPRHQPRR